MSHPSLDPRFKSKLFEDARELIQETLVLREAVHEQMDRERSRYTEKDRDATRDMNWDQVRAYWHMRENELFADALSVARVRELSALREAVEQLWAIAEQWPVPTTDPGDFA